MRVFFGEGRDYGALSVPNIFLEKYMPSANGTHVKVYLYALKKAYERGSEGFSMSELASHLSLSLEDVEMAWQYWGKVGLVRIHRTGEMDESIEFFDPRSLEEGQRESKDDFNEEPDSDDEDKSFSPATDVERLVQANHVPEINSMFNSIDQMLRRATSNNEKMTILSWIMENNMNPDVILEAFILASKDKRRLNVKYVGGMIKNWYTRNLTNMEALEEYLKSNEERMYEYRMILRSLGVKRNITEAEMKLVDKWRDTFQYGMDVISQAMDKTVQTSNPSLAYVDGVLSDWYRKGIRTVAEIAEKDVRPETPKTESRRTNRNRFNNFEQRTSEMSSEELEELFHRQRRDLIEEDF